MRALLLAATLTFAAFAAAQESLPVSDVLRGLRQMFQQQCKQEGNENRGSSGTDRFAIEDSRVMRCECTPERISALLTELPAKELARQISTQEEVLPLIKQKVFAPCGLEQMKRPFVDRCEERLEGVDREVDSPTMCACMRKAMDATSESQAFEFGMAFADYAQKSAEAKKKGEPRIPFPAALEPFMKSRTQCAEEARPKKPPG